MAALEIKLNADDAIARIRSEMAAHQPVLRVKRLRPDAILPTRGTEHSIGLDLYAAPNPDSYGDYDIPMGKRARISTGIAVAIPSGYYGRVAPRSGLALKVGIDVMAGVIDPDYTGEVQVLLLNTDMHRTFKVKPGDRIAQLILERADMLPVEEVDELDDTARGGNGYGSTGS